MVSISGVVDVVAVDVWVVLDVTSIVVVVGGTVDVKDSVFVSQL